MQFDEDASSWTHLDLKHRISRLDSLYTKPESAFSARISMPRLMVTVFLLIFSLIQLGAQTFTKIKTGRQMTNTEKEVLEVVKTWNDSFERNDNTTYFTHIHNDLTLFVPSSPYRIDGKQDDKEEFEWSLGKSRTKVHFFQELQPNVQVYGNTAVVTYYNRGAYGPDGNEQIYYFKETNVLVKENDK